MAQNSKRTNFSYFFLAQKGNLSQILIPSCLIENLGIAYPYILSTINWKKAGEDYVAK